jgi:dimethylargininase
VTHIALIRPVSRRIAQCELTHLAREPIDYDTAVAQHAEYEAALLRAGCEIVQVPAADDMPDAVFVEDVAVVLDEIAVMTRPGAASRRAEGAGVEAVLKRYRNIVRITEPGTIDGGDVLRVGKTFFVGRTERTNDDGIGQLRSQVASFGYDVRAVNVSGCLHLKTAVSAVGESTLLGNSAYVSRDAFGDVEWIEIDTAEPYAGNALWLGTRVIYARAFVRTAQILREHLGARGVTLDLVDASELAKAESGVTCCSLVLRA